MKRSMLMLLITSSFIGHGQVSLQPMVPAIGMLQKSQLWNILVINNSAESYNCRLDIVLTDRSTNLEIFTATSGNVEIPVGAKQLNSNALNAVQYNYLSGGSYTTLQTLMPVGSYTACYTLTALGTKEFTLAEECVQFDVEALSPPMLISPADSSQLEMSPAQFSWVPPTPVAMFDRLSYEIMITPVNEGQTALEALQENIPIYSESNLQPNFLNYNGSINAFEKNKWYAWQVVARDNINYAAKSETWVFKLPDLKVKPAGSPNYISLNKGLENQPVHYVKGQVLSVNYYNDERESISKIAIYSTGRKLIQHDTRKLAYGDNFFSIKLKGGLLKDQIYIIEITGTGGKKYSALFSISN